MSATATFQAWSSTMRLVVEIAARRAIAVCPALALRLEPDSR